MRENNELLSSRDITDRRIVEDADRLQINALNAAANGIMITDSRGTIEWVNSAFTELTGYTSTEAIGKNPRDLLKSKVQDPKFYKDLWETILAGKVWRGDLVNRRKDGSYYEEEQTITPVRDLDGKIAHFIAIKQDVTERNTAEKMLRESEDLNRSLYKAAERRLSQTIALRTIDRAISDSLDLNFTLDILLTQAVKELGVDAADILMYNEITNILDFCVGQGFRTPAVQNLHLPLGKGYAGKAVLERKSLHLSQLRTAKTEFEDSNFIAMEEFDEFHCVPLITKGRVLGVLETFNRTSFPRNGEWIDFMETLAGQAARAIENITLLDNLQKANADLVAGYNSTIEGWSRALDLRDKETEGHTQRVASLTLTLASNLGVKDEDLVHMRRGALLHDIGKMGIPDSILHKPGLLDADEWEKMKQHPIYAYNMLLPIQYLKAALDIPYCHHEKWDGSGYPRGLKGAEIPFAARIFAVVDVWDALTSDRPYRKAWSKQEAIAHIQQQSGLHFDPQVCDTFIKMIGTMV